MAKARSNRGFLFGIALTVGLYIVGSIAWIVVNNEKTSIEVDRDGDPNTPIVVLEIRDVDPERGALTAAVTLVGGGSLAEKGGRLRDPVSLDVYPTVGQAALDFDANSVPDTVLVEFAADGDPNKWPLDRYVVDDLDVVVYVGATRSEVEPELLIGESATGWVVRSSGANGDSLTVSRSNSFLGAGILLCALLIGIAAMALFVAIQTLREKKQWYPPFMSWFGTILFAIVPLRGAFPGSPPMGAWVDRFVVLWVLIGVVVAMGVYLRCWWKFG